ncbi:hypothetical protein [Actinomadura rupiterrae]|uniref:hypothetical protein n=1 Tax=Actinomadura rupiterrae TaxID=559627 RepID=UPI0020A51936|nr:hypothetical protein [Actinomadura rupiterrae]MCP2341932.1 hypothetical protein [Actinomadura rupiterrae]
MALFTAASLDAVYARDEADGRASLYVTKGLRYTVYVEESMASPSALSLTGASGVTTPLKVDAKRHGDGERLEERGRTYRWVGAFTSPADGLAAVNAEPGGAALRVQVDAPGFGTSAALVLVSPLVLLACLVWEWWIFRGRRRTKGYWTRRPSAGAWRATRKKRAELAREALAGRWPDGTALANGTLLASASGTSAEGARERLARVGRPDVSDARVRKAEGGWLVEFPEYEVAVFVAAGEAKSRDCADVMRCAVAKFDLDARNPVLTRA